MQTVLRLPVWLKRTVSLPRGAVRAAAAGRDLPARPVEPGPEDCCQSGCSICVWDIYRDALKEYEQKLAQQGLHDQTESAAVATASDSDAKATSMMDASMDALAQLEAQLEQQAKQRQQQKQ